jgi:hypothetical protein
MLSDRRSACKSPVQTILHLAGAAHCCVAGRMRLVLTREEAHRRLRLIAGGPSHIRP